MRRMKHTVTKLEQITRPYRVLHCIDNLGRGGAESQLVQTLAHIDKTRFDNSVCHLNSPDDLKGSIVKSGLPVTNLNIGNPRNLFKAIKGLRRLIREHHIELIHASTSYSNFYAPIVGIIEHIPVIFTLTTTHNAKVHGQTRGSFLRRLRVKNFFLWRAAILKIAKAGIVAVSNTVKESAIKDLRIPAERIEVVYRGLVPEQYAQQDVEIIQKAKQKLGLADAYPILINVGRLWPVKGQKDLILAMSMVAKSFPQAKLLIAGQGPLQAELEELCDRLGLKDHVKLLGLRNDVPLLLAISDIYVAASYLEGFPNVIAEAMAAGKPIVSYDIPACREILEGEAGVLIGQRDPERLALEVSRLAADSEKMRAMGSRGMDIVRKSFDIRCNTKRLEDIYKKIISET